MAKRSRARRAASAAGRGARALGRWSVQGAKGSAAAGAAGVVTYIAYKTLSSKVEMARKHPIATPILLGVGGHLLKRKFQSLGAGVVGAAAGMAAMAFDVNRANKPADTQALTNPSDIQALTSPSDIRGPMDELDAVIETQGVEEDSGVYSLGEAASIGL